ncbi:MAG: RagB/SusD family nutrient uptake outer membrane protein [Cyclobacteriaceae bacterium]
MINKIKKHHNKIILLASMILIIGCKEDFLENPPLTTTTDEIYPSSASEALLVTNGAYNTFRNWWISGGYPLANIMSDDQTKGSEDGSNPDLQQFEDFSYSASHQYIAAWYQTIYQGIRRAHVVIEKVPEIDMDEDLRSRYVAEAKFIRAYMYFTLVSIFDEVPLVTTLNPDRIVPKSTANDIYDQLIIPDLLACIDLLPEKSEYAASEAGRATRGAAKSLLARVYLFRGDFVNAEKYSLEVILSGEYQLDPDFANVFTVEGQHGIGSIFEIGALQAGFGDGGNQYGNTQGVRGNPNWGWGFGRPTWDFLNSFEAEDPRMDASVIFLGEVLGGTEIVGDANTSDTTYNENDQIIEIECYNQKVYVEGSESTQENFGHNRKILRYADVLLMAAEALNENDKITESRTYLNLVRERARGGNTTILPDITTDDKVELRQAIWDERRSELAFESLRYFDLKRTNRMMEVLGPLGFTPKYTHCPIPQQEIDLTEGGIAQHPDWAN